jgi:hypothetical protein
MLESRIGSVAGATGAIYAIRKSLFKTIPKNILLDDVYVPMQIVFSGYRNVFDAEAVAYDYVSKDSALEKKRKVRTLLGNYQILNIIPQLLSPRRNPIFLRYVSHKVLRLFVPFLFLGLLFSTILANGLFYKFVLMMSILVFLLAYLHKSLHGLPVVGKAGRFARAFVSLNYYATIAFVRYLFPKKDKIW